MTRKQVFILYRTKLRLCRHMGYQYGTWDQNFRQPRKHLSSNYIHYLMRRNRLGEFIWNNIRMQYKLCLHEPNPFYIEDAIDDAFVSLRYINYLAMVYKDKQKLLT